MANLRRNRFLGLPSRNDQGTAGAGAGGGGTDGRNAGAGGKKSPRRNKARLSSPLNALLDGGIVW